jgi:mannose-6-phosphate isomerase
MSGIQPISFLKPELHPKKWGSETWAINTPLYCLKILDFIAGHEFSDHYHWIKDECWYLLEGELRLDYYDLSNAEKQWRHLYPGDVIHIPPGNPHKLTAIKNSRVLEVSTTHHEEDSYRIGKGSSQL